MQSCINIPKRSRRNKAILVLYIIFAVYLVYVAIFLASMLFKSARNVKSKMKGLPQYMSDTDISKIKVSAGSLGQQLGEAFNKADDNNNGYLEKEELAEWIQMKVSEHVTVGVKTNFKVFLLLDKSPKDGWVSMAEYDALFLSSRGVQKEQDLIHTAREQLMSERAEFLEIAEEDEKLTIDQLLTFRHPESSHAHLLERVTELTDTLDEDGDGALSLSELLQLSDPVYRPSDEETSRFPVQSEAEMRALFSRLDINADQTLNQHEILVFLDPRHGEHALKDASRLLRVADADGDGSLTLAEIQMHPDQFRIIVDARHKFHQLDDRR